MAVIPDSIAPCARTKYAGSGWIRATLQVEMSPLGELVADILGAVYRGIYHMEERVLRNVAWGSTQGFRVRVPSGISTYDGAQLTELVTLCHDAAIRLEIRPSGAYTLALWFSPRTRGGSSMTGHATIEEAIGRARELAHVGPLS